MNRFKRPLAIALAGLVSIFVFLSGYMTALAKRGLPLHEAGLSALTNAQWAALQASNALLMGIFSPHLYLPLLVRREASNRLMSDLSRSFPAKQTKCQV